MQLPKDFKDFLKLLNSHNVKYLLIGGYAVGYHGYPRATGDIDIWIAISLENATKLVNVIREFGFDIPELVESLFLQEKNVVRMGNFPLRIEILTSISGVEFDECYQNRIMDFFDEVEIPIINLNDLKINKQASGRLKDLDDLQHLQK